MDKTENYVREFYDIFFAQKRVIFWTTAVFLVLAVLVAFLWPPTYSATGSILVKGKKIEKSPESLTQTYEKFYPVTKEDLVSEEQTLRSFDVAKKTLIFLKSHKLYKKRSPSFIASIFNKSSKYAIVLKKNKEGALPKDFIDEVYGVMDSIKTEVIPSSNVIRVAFFDKNPGYATTVVNTLMNQYLLYRQEINSPGQVELFYHGQVARIKKLLDEKEQALMALAEKINISNPDREIENNLLLKKDLMRQLSSLKRDFIEKKMYVKHLKNALASKKVEYFSFITYDQSKVITDMSSRLLNAFVERENALETFKQESRKIKLIDKKIKHISSSLKREVASYIQNQVNELNILKNKLAQVKKRLRNLDDINILLKRQVIKAKGIKRDIDLLQSSYTTLQRREEEARINSAVNATNLSYFVSIMSRAFPSNGPVFPKKGVVIPLGLLIGFIIGCSFGFMREYFDHTFKKPRDVEAYVGLPVLFSIPKSEYRMKKVLAFAIFALVISTAFGALVLPKNHTRVMDSSSIKSPQKTKKIGISPAAMIIAPTLYKEKENVPAKKIISTTGKIRISSIHEYVSNKKGVDHGGFSRRRVFKKVEYVPVESILLKSQREPIAFLLNPGK